MLTALLLFPAISFPLSLSFVILLIGASGDPSKILCAACLIADFPIVLPVLFVCRNLPLLPRPKGARHQSLPGNTSACDGDQPSHIGHRCGRAWSRGRDVASSS